MSFWSKLGKIGLAAAPYVAAPFTGGASLAFAPAANAALQKWNQADAQKAAAKGIAPSSFDKYVGMGSGIASVVGGATGGFGMGTSATAGQGGGWQGELGKIGGMTSGIMNNIPSGGGSQQYNPNAQRGGDARTGQLSGSNQGQSGQNSQYYQSVRGNNQNQGIGPSYQYPQGYQPTNQQQAYSGGSSSGGSQNKGIGPLRQYTGEDVGHEGTTRGGMNRQQYRDSWMGSGIGNNQQMDAWLAANGGQRLNDSGVVRTPFGEILDMGIGYKGGKGQAGWTDIGMNDLSPEQGWGQAYNPPPQSPVPEQTDPNEPSYEDFVRDYWAPDRDAVLASKAPQNQPVPQPANQTYARKIGRGGQYVNA
jgi:hypothetical protein